MPSAAVATGDAVFVRGADWEVLGVTPCEACTLLYLEGCGADNAGVRRVLIAPFDRPVVRRPGRLVRRRRHAVLRAAWSRATSTRPAGGLWAAADAAIELMPFQLEPAMAVLGGATRVLLADQVGLGKTIQAGLILAELQARRLVAHALVLVPAGLRLAWSAELAARFGIETAVMDREAIALGTADRPAGVNPWAACPVVIASLDYAKRDDVAAAVAQVPWDVLIVDEAHHLTPGSDRGRTVASLAWRVPWLVLASATPHSGDEPAFGFLTGLGRMHDSLVVFRRGRGEVGAGAGRREHLLRVVPAAAERAAIAAAHRYARRIYFGRGREEPGARLVAIALARRAASSPTALARTLARRLSLLSGEPAAEMQAALPWDEADADEDGEGGSWLAIPGLDDAEDERQTVASLLAMARACEGVQSKIGRIERLVDRVREPVLVFSEYRDTVEAARQALAPRGPVAVIHGAMPEQLRHEAVHRFTHGDAAVLLATDTAGEGLNLHRRCRLVVNLELPWNPLRIEQRVGRVDRIGQSRRVHALHLYHAGTVEDLVLASLERRRACARTALGARQTWVDEDEVARAAFGGEPLVLREGADVPTASALPSRTEALRLVETRRAAAGSAREKGGCVWALPRRAGDTPSVVALHDVVIAGADRRLVAREAVAIAVALPERPRDKRDWRRAVAALARDDRVRACALAEAARRARHAAAILAPFAHAVSRRLGRIAARVRAEAGPARQAALFDRRAEREAALGAHTRARLLAALQERLESVRHTPPGDMQVQTRLAAAWPVRAALPSPGHKPSRT